MAWVDGYLNVPNKVFTLGLNGKELGLVVWLMSHQQGFKISFRKASSDLGYKSETLAKMRLSILSKIKYNIDDFSLKILKICTDFGSPSIPKKEQGCSEKGTKVSQKGNTINNINKKINKNSRYLEFLEKQNKESVTSFSKINEKTNSFLSKLFGKSEPKGLGEFL